MLGILGFLGRAGMGAMNKIGRFGAYPFIGLEGLEFAKGIGTAKEGVKDQDVSETASGLGYAYPSALLMPPTVEYARQVNPKITGALEKIPGARKATTVIKMLEKGIGRLPGAKFVEKRPFTTIVGTVAGVPLAEQVIDDVIDKDKKADTFIEEIFDQDVNLFNAGGIVNMAIPRYKIGGFNEKETEIIEPIVEDNTENMSMVPNIEDNTNNMSLPPVVESVLSINRNKNKNINNNDAPFLPNDVRELSNTFQSIIRNQLRKDKPTLGLFLAKKDLDNAIMKKNFSLYQQAKADLLNKRGSLPDFDEYYEKFRQRAGDAVPQESKDFILLKLGLNLMSGRSDMPGFAGALDIASRAGSLAIDEMTQIYNLEKEERKALAMHYMGLEQDLEENLDQDKKDLLVQEMNFMKNISDTASADLKSVLDYKAAMVDSIDKVNQLEKEAYEKKHKVGDTQVLPIPNDKAFFGIGSVKVAKSDLDGETLFQLENEPFRTLPEFNKFMEQKAIEVEKDNPELAQEYRNNKISPQQTRVSAIKPFVYADNRKKLDSVRSITQTITSLENVSNLTDRARVGGMSATGFVGGFNEVLTRAIDIVKDVTGSNKKDLLLQNLSAGAPELFIPENITFVVGDKVFTGEEARSQIFLRYEKEIASAGAKALRAGMNNTEMNNAINNLGIDGIDAGSLSLDEKRQIFRQIKIAEVQLKYSLANAFKGEDRLTEKNLAEFGKLVTFIGGLQSERDVQITINTLTRQAYDRLFFDINFLKRAAMQDADLKSLLTVEMYDKLDTMYKNRMQEFGTLEGVAKKEINPTSLLKMLEQGIK